MSLDEIRNSYDMSVSPSDDVVAIVDGLLKNIRNYSTLSTHSSCIHSTRNNNKLDLLHLMNIISHKNKEQWLPIFDKIRTSKTWPSRNNEIFAQIAIRQPLFADLYVDMLDRLPLTDQELIIDLIKSCPKENIQDMKTAGIFLSKYIISQKWCVSKIKEFLDFDYSDGRALLVITMFVGLGTLGNTDLIPVDLYKTLESMNHDTHTLMSLYDLDDIMSKVIS